MGIVDSLISKEQIPTKRPHSHGNVILYPQSSLHSLLTLYNAGMLSSPVYMRKLKNRMTLEDDKKGLNATSNDS